MAVYKRFEDLPVWQEAARLYNLALDLLQAHNVRLGPGWRASIRTSNSLRLEQYCRGIRVAHTQRPQKLPSYCPGIRRRGKVDGGNRDSTSRGATTRSSASGDSPCRRKLHQAIGSLNH